MTKYMAHVMKYERCYAASDSFSVCGDDIETLLGEAKREAIEETAKLEPGYGKYDHLMLYDRDAGRDIAEYRLINDEWVKDWSYEK